ncbi:MAG: IS1595 family transposase [Terriglobia bacterium]
MPKVTTLDAPRFHNEEAARKHLEAMRWPHGPECPHCGGTERNVALKGKSHRPGLYFCGDCRKQFTVTVGTVFERSKIPLHKWVLATHLLCASKKGMSSHQLHRMLGVTYKTAWFMTHRIREAMTITPSGQLGRGGKTVEADETYWGNQPGKRKRRGYEHKMKVLALVERDGDVRSFHVPAVNAKTLRPILRQQIAAEAKLMTDEAGVYRPLGKDFASHGVVNHSAGVYADGDLSTNTIESVFSLLKRGLVGTFHHVSEEHLQRYLHEFDFRYNNRKITDEERSDHALRSIGGKRLTYKIPCKTEEKITSHV